MAKFWKRKAVFFCNKKAPHNRFTGFLPSFPRSVVSPGCCCWMESSSRVCDRVIFLFFFFFLFLFFHVSVPPPAASFSPFVYFFRCVARFLRTGDLIGGQFFNQKYNKKKTRDGRPFVFVVLSPALPQQDTRLRFSILLLLRLLLLLPFLTHLL